MFQIRMKWFLSLPILIGCAATLVTIASEGFVVTDIFAFGELPFPSKREWESLIEARHAEIIDGSKNEKFLNACFEGGWRRCFEKFSVKDQPWNYKEVLLRRPDLLSGNMVDTDRIAGNLGWKKASDVIESEITSTSEEIVRGQIRYVNRKVLVSGLVICGCIGWFVLFPAVKRGTKQRYQQNKGTGDRKRN